MVLKLISGCGTAASFRGRGFFVTLIEPELAAFGESCVLAVFIDFCCRSVRRAWMPFVSLPFEEVVFESVSFAECGIPATDAVAAMAVIVLAIEQRPGVAAVAAVAGCGTVVEDVVDEEVLLLLRPFVVDMSGADHLRSKSGCMVDVITSGNCTLSLLSTVPVLRALIRRSSSSNTSSIRFVE